MKIGITCYPTYGGSRRRRHRAGRGARRGAATRSTSSRYALPVPPRPLAEPRLFFHEVVVAAYPLFEYPPYTLALATKMAEVAATQGSTSSTSTTRCPTPSRASWRGRSWRRSRLPVVTTLHGTDITLVGQDPNYVETTRFGIEQSDAVTAVSEDLRRVTMDRLGIKSGIDVVPNFIDPARYEAGATAGARRRAGPGEHVLVHVSNFRPVKRVQDVIEVFRRVRREVPAHLLMVGDARRRAPGCGRCGARWRR